MHVIRKICHRVAVMEAGKIVEIGDVLEVFQSPQQQITKRFVAQITESADSSETITKLLQQYSAGKLIKLIFVGDRTEQPILTRLIRNYDVTVNLAHGNVSHTKGGAYGTLILHIDGEPALIDEAIQFLHTEGVKTEVLTHD